MRNALKRDALTPLAETLPAAGAAPGITSGRLPSFRHFFCSRSAHCGVPEQMPMSFLGHRDSEMGERDEAAPGDWHSSDPVRRTKPRDPL